MKSSTLLFIFLFISCVSPSETENIEGCGEFGYYPENCSSEFQFEIEISGGLAYVYQSENGKLKKLINPFVTPIVYADTLINLSDKERCLVFDKMKTVDILKYPTLFNPKSRVKIDLEPAFHLRFNFGGTTKVINWTANTEIIYCSEAIKLKEFILLIDSLIVNKQEFRSLPTSEFDWL